MNSVNTVDSDEFQPSKAYVIDILILCDIYLLQLGFHPLAVVGRFVQK